MTRRWICLVPSQIWAAVGGIAVSQVDGVAGGWVSARFSTVNVGSPVSVTFGLAPGGAVVCSRNADPGSEVGAHV